MSRAANVKSKLKVNVFTSTPAMFVTRTQM